MPITAVEIYGSRTPSGADCSMVYMLLGDTSAENNYAHLTTIAPPAVAMGGRLFVRAKDPFTLKQIGPDQYEGECKYHDPTADEQGKDGQHDPSKTDPDVDELSIDTTGGTFHITASKKTVIWAAPGEVAPNFEGLINVRDKKPQGIDIIVPMLKITYKKIWPFGQLNSAYSKLLARLTGRVNKGPFKSFAAGELLFEGARGSQKFKAGEPAEITYSFLASENRLKIPVKVAAQKGGAYVPGGGPAPAGQIEYAKDGHQYAWIYWREQKEQPSTSLCPRMVAVYVETVYDSADFTLLGIGQ